MTGPEEKKAAPDGVSREQAGDLVPLVRELQETGEFHPVVFAIRDGSANPVVWLGRAVAVAGLTSLLLLGLSLAGVRAAPQIVWLGLFFLVLPLWGVLSVGAWRDLLEGGTSQRMPDQLDRWGPTLIAGIPGLVAHLGALYVATAGIHSLGHPQGWLLVPVVYVLVSLSWGFTVCDLVLHRAGRASAGIAGPPRALAGLLRLPLVAARWLARPRLPGLRAGTGLVLPLLLMVWAGTIGGLLLGSVLGTCAHVGMLFLGLPRVLSQLAFLFSATAGATLGFELGVGMCTYNYLGVRAEAREPLPEEIPPRIQ